MNYLYSEVRCRHVVTRHQEAAYSMKDGRKANAKGLTFSLEYHRTFFSRQEVLESSLCSKMLELLVL